MDRPICKKMGDLNRTEIQKTPPKTENLVLPSFTPSRSGSTNQAESDLTATDSSKDGAFDTEESGQDRSNPELSKRRRMPLKESLGHGGMAIILCGTVGILGGYAFLTFLWFGHGSQEEASNATWVWRQLALQGYMNQAVTLTSLVLCAAVGLQATVCTSMLAALVLEKRATRKTQVATISVLRAINDGPSRLAQLMLGSKTLGVFGHIEFWLVSLLAVVGLTLQFLSTILLTDVHDFAVVGDLRDTQVSSLLPPNTSRSDVGETLELLTFYSGQTVFPIFSETTSLDAGLMPNEHSLSDTGLKQKGFLPLASSMSRTGTRQYEGNAMVLNTRVACMPPTMNASISAQNWTASDGDSEQVYGYGWINGELDYSQSLRNAGITGAPWYNASFFGCGLPGATESSGGKEWESAFCLVDGVGGSVRLVGDETGDMESFWNTTDDPWAPQNTIFLVMTTTMSGEEWLSIDGEVAFSEGTTFGEWTSFEAIPDRYINISVCFPAFNVERHSVRMDTVDTALTEPQLSWSVASPHYNTTDIRTYLGADYPECTPSERRILDLEILGPATTSSDGPAALDTSYNETVDILTAKVLEMATYYVFTDATILNNTFSACWDCNIDWTFMYGNYMIVSSDIINYTNRAASMFDAFITMLAFNLYQTFLSNVGTNETIQLASVESTQAPLRCATSGCPGYVSATLLLAVHLALVLAITGLYIRQAHFSRYSSIWPAIAQLVSDELRDTLANSTEWSDDHVETTATKEQQNSWVRLERLADGKRVQVVNIPDAEGGASRETKVSGHKRFRGRATW